jgi:biopolymer transport protein ExbD
MHWNTPSKISATPNVTPMVDVMLVLLIIFMVVTPALQSGAVAEPPVAEHLKERPDSGNDHTLLIDADGAFYFDQRAITRPELVTTLQRLYRADAVDRSLYVRAHGQLRYGQVRDALELVSENGVRVVHMVTTPKPR